MSISQTLVLVFLALILGQIKPLYLRNILVLIGSLLIYYHYQSASPILFLDFWLPTIAISLGLLLWIAAQSKFSETSKSNLATFFLTILIILAVSANRHLSICCITQTRPPSTWTAAIFLTALILPIALTLSKQPLRSRLAILMAVLIANFILLKNPDLSLLISKAWRSLNQQDIRFSTANDLSWLGISYILFRMLHLLIDLRAGRLVQVNLADALNYLFFFPTLLAGPIARFPPFRDQLDSQPQLHDVIDGGRRVFVGLFRKFVLADSLALLSLSAQNAFQIQSPWLLWLALFAYSLRIYLDFSGYTDIAIGSARLMGINLPENFNSPYWKTSLIQFWNSWHITLADWFRSYVFNPMTRKFRTTRSLPSWLTILVPQLTTMILIGLWHSITPNFLIWGTWHGIGLFINNRWNTYTKSYPLRIANSLQNIMGWTLTFVFVSVGWVWFLMPNLSDAIRVLSKLIGLGG